MGGTAPRVCPDPEDVLNPKWRYYTGTRYARLRCATPVCNPEEVMSLMQFWSDLSMWNKYGLSAIMAVGLLALIFFIFF